MRHATVSDERLARSKASDLFEQVRAAEARGDKQEADRLYDLYWVAVNERRNITRQLNEETYRQLALEAEAVRNR